MNANGMRKTTAETTIATRPPVIDSTLSRFTGPPPSVQEEEQRQDDRRHHEEEDHVTGSGQAVEAGLVLLVDHGGDHVAGEPGPALVIAQIRSNDLRPPMSERMITVTSQAGPAAT